MRARPSGVAVLAGALALAWSVAPVPTSAVTTDQSYRVPVSKRITVSGHGFGHGHGMSQYGAQGAALSGLGYRDILSFYYPGTTPVEARGNIRVLITSDTTDDVVVSPVPGLRVRDLGTGTRYELPVMDGVRRWRLAVDAQGRTVVDYLTTRWQRWSPEGVTTLVGDGEFSAGRPLTLWTPSGSKQLRGAVRAASPRAGEAARDTVNVLSLDAYVKGVIPDEMPASWHPEAVKAQAVAARTYGVWSRSQNKRRYYQICDTTSCQVYGGLGAEDSRSNAAVRATAREILTYAGKPAFTQFSSSSGGWTSAGSVPYLPAQADPYDRFDGNPMHAWSTTVDASRIERAYPRLGRLQTIRVVSRDGNGDWRGRVWSMVLDGSKADVTISGDTFRWMLGLRASWFTIGATSTPMRKR
jgi:SpoIID/LytB domain protein